MGHVFLKCGTAAPSKGLSRRILGKARARNTAPRPEATAARSSLELPAQTGGAAHGHHGNAARRRAQCPPLRLDFQVTLRSTEVNPQGRQALAAAPSPFTAQARLLSHKFITNFDASIPACPEHRGPSTLCRGAEGAPAVCRRTTGVWWALLRQSIDCRALINPPVYGCLCRFILY